jgi:hypothetical protein
LHIHSFCRQMLGRCRVWQWLKAQQRASTAPTHFPFDRLTCTLCQI